MAYRLGQVLLLFIENRHGIGVRLTNKIKQSIRMGRFSAVHSYSQKRTLLRIHADKSLSNLSGIECPVRITFWSLIFWGRKSYSMSYVLILNRKHFPVSFIGRRIAFSALSCCKSNIYFRLMQIFEEKKCILIADLLKKKSFSSRITYSVIDVNVYI